MFTRIKAILIMNSDKTVKIYCDGSCLGNPGAGGWAAILIYNGHEKQVHGYEVNSTNNRMELTAAIKALETLTQKVSVEIFTDSQYVKNGITNWIFSWKKNNWKNGKIKNIDLWKKLDTISEKHDIEWNWVKGHSGDRYNEIADELARFSALEGKAKNE